MWASSSFKAGGLCGCMCQYGLSQNEGLGGTVV